VAIKTRQMGAGFCSVLTRSNKYAPLGGTNIDSSELAGRLARWNAGSVAAEIASALWIVMPITWSIPSELSP